MVVIESKPGAALGSLETGDCEALRRLFARLSPETVYRRFLSPIPSPDHAALRRLLDVDGHDRAAVCALVDGEIVGVARYARLAGTARAELAVVVADAWHRQGLAGRMVGALAALAEAAGIARFHATLLADNQPAIALLQRISPGLRFQLSEGTYETTFAVGRNG